MKCYGSVSEEEPTCTQSRTLGTHRGRGPRQVGKGEGPEWRERPRKQVWVWTGRGLQKLAADEARGTG